MLALVIALSGSAYAVSVAKDSVGAPQIKKNAVRSPEVRNGSLEEKDFKKGQLPAGPTVSTTSTSSSPPRGRAS